LIDPRIAHNLLRCFSVKIIRHI